MGFKEILQKMRDKNQEKKALLNQVQAEDKVETLVEERKKSANQREYERFVDEDNEEKYKQALKVLRRERRDDIAFNHNPAQVGNITNHSDFAIMKAKNITKGDNLFTNNKNLFKNNDKTYRSKNITKSDRKTSLFKK
jgi:hypothetical protein